LVSSIGGKVKRGNTRAHIRLANGQEKQIEIVSNIVKE
jgi:hypothetical protein